MHHAGKPAALDHGQCILPGFARMDDDGLSALGRNRQLALERFLLDRARRKIVVVVQADFANGNHLGMRRQFAQLRERLLAGFGCVMRMHANGGVNEIVLLGQPYARFQIRRAMTRAHGDHASHTGGHRASNGIFAIGIESFVVEMRVRIGSIAFRSGAGAFACQARAARLRREAGGSACPTITSSALQREYPRGIPPAPVCRPQPTRRRSCRSIRCPSVCAVRGWRQSPLCD